MPVGDQIEGQEHGDFPIAVLVVHGAASRKVEFRAAKDCEVLHEASRLGATECLAPGSVVGAKRVNLFRQDLSGIGQRSERTAASGQRVLGGIRLCGLFLLLAGGLHPSDLCGDFPLSFLLLLAALGLLSGTLFGGPAGIALVFGPQVGISDPLPFGVGSLALSADTFDGASSGAGTV